jgi:ribosome maturation factor RimP
MNSLQIFADQLHGIDPALLEGVLVPVLLAHAVEVVDVSFRNERGWVLRVCVESVGEFDADEADAESGGLGAEVIAGGKAVSAARPATEPSEPAAEEGAQVTLSQLTDISRDLSAALDVADFISHRYSLEVSSPGLDRPLRGVRDFRRFLGRLAKLHLARPAADGQRVLRGRLVAVGVTTAAPAATPVPAVGAASGPSAATTMIGSAARGTDAVGRADGVAITVEVDGKDITVPLANVTRAHLVFEMPGQPKKGPNGHRKAKHDRAQREAGLQGAEPPSNQQER